MTMDQLPGQDLIGMFLGILGLSAIVALLIILPTALAAWMLTH